MRSLTLFALVLGAATLVACGDAGGTASNLWTGVGNNNNPAGGDGGGGGGNDSGGGGGNDSGGGPVDSGVSNPSFDIMLDKTAVDSELRATVDIQVTVAPKNFTGAVALDVQGLPAGVTAKFVAPTLNVSGNAGMTTMLTLTVASDTAPNLANVMVRGTSGSNIGSAPLGLNVKPILTISIPTNLDALKGTSGNPSTNAFGTFPIVVTSPTNIAATPVEVRFVNKDSSGHCIHASNPTQGFAHDPVTNGVCNALIPQNGMSGQMRKVKAIGAYTFYLHDQGDLTCGQGMVR